MIETDISLKRRLRKKTFPLAFVSFLFTISGSHVSSAHQEPILDVETFQTHLWYLNLPDRLGPMVPPNTPGLAWMPEGEVWLTRAELLDPDRGKSLEEARKDFEGAIGRWQAHLNEYVDVARAWPATIQIVVEEKTPTFARPPALPTLYAGMANQPILVDLRGEGDTAFPRHQEVRVNLSASPTLVLEYDETRPRLVQVNLGLLPEGTRQYSVAVVDQNGAHLGDLPLEITGAPSGFLKVEIIDAASDSLTPARVGIYTEERGFVLPAEVIRQYDHNKDHNYYRGAADPTWPGNDQRIFYSSGKFETAVPPGPCRLVVKKGLEYLLHDETFEIEVGETLTRAVSMARWIDLPEKGWYSCDDHAHIRRDGSNDKPILQLAQAEDVHVVNASQMGDLYQLHFLQYAWGDEGMASHHDYIVRAGQEDPRTNTLGHTLMFGLTNTIHDRETYYIYSDVFDRAHEMGGLGGYAHFGSGMNAERGLTIDVPSGKVDFIEVLQMRQLNTDVIYHFWNLGFRLTPAAGSDYPYAPIIGSALFFVNVDSPFNFDNWMKGFEAGHTFVSDGPILEFDVKGELPGSEIKLSGPGAVPVRATARINPTLDKLERLEIVSMGEVIKTVTAGSDGKLPLEIRMDLEIDESVWIAARAYATQGRAHTAPVYIEVGGKRIVKKDDLAASLERVEGKLKEVEEIMGDKSHHPTLYANAPRLQELINRAREEYSNLMNLATSPNSRKE